MPGKSAHVKNEKQYEALKDKGMSKSRAAKHSQLPRSLQARRTRSPARDGNFEPGRHNRAAQGRRPQRWQGGGAVTVTSAPSAYESTFWRQ